LAVNKVRAIHELPGTQIYFRIVWINNIFRGFVRWYMLLYMIAQSVKPDQDACW